MRINLVVGQVSLFDHDTVCGKTSPVPSPARAVRISGRLLNRLSRLRNHRWMLLDLRPGAGNMLGPCWEYDPVWLGSPGTRNTSECPSAVVVSSLSQILQATAPYRYYLTRIACLGILRRAEERGKALPKMLETALMIQAGFKKLYHYNKRFAQQAAGFLAESSATAHTVGFEEGLAPTMKAGGKSGAVMLPTYCLNDQGGQRMDYAEDQSGTLRAQSHVHEPLIFENHGIDARYTGPHEVSPTMSARYGTGGNNTPLVARETAWCITGNAIDREPQNGGNGLGINENIAFTLTATDHHAVFSRQRTDLFKPDEIASTESARQYKDATDLVLEAGESLEALLIRRLMPVECERLQGYPDGWTELPGASDSARYKALGNSVAIPCVDRLMLGIAAAYQKGLRYELPQ